MKKKKQIPFWEILFSIIFTMTLIGLAIPGAMIMYLGAWGYAVVEMQSQDPTMAGQIWSVTKIVVFCFGFLGQVFAWGHWFGSRNK